MPTLKPPPRLRREPAGDMLDRPMGRPRTRQPDPSTPEGQWALYLAHLLRKKKVRAEELADALGKSRSVIFRYLAGEVAPPLAQWDDMAKALGMANWLDLVPPRKFVESLS